MFCSLLVFILGCADNRPVKGRYPKAGLASWYSAARTSTGDKYDGKDFTCAMRRIDFGKFYKVCRTDSDKCVVVRHNDFGPAKYMYNRGRIIDLSRAAFAELAPLSDGLVEVTVEEAFVQTGK